MPTGEVELAVDELTIVSRSTPLPFQLDEENVDETLRLRYRWLDLRREKLQRNLRLRAQMVGIIRRHMEDGGLPRHPDADPLQVDARGRARLRRPEPPAQGAFFALPQSPQILKQLTMIAGFDRYYQIAICFRDEDLRADRVQEITQLDVEMSFPDREVLFRLMEEMFAAIWRECLGVEIATPWPRMTFAEADRRFGSDKPDTRFGLELEDATEVDARLGVRGLRRRGGRAVPPRPADLLARRARRLEELAKERGAKGLAYLVRDEGGEVRSPIAKFLSRARARRARTGARRDAALRGRRVGRRPRASSATCGSTSAASSGLIDDAAFTFLWVTDFPMFEWDEDEERWAAVHHPFTRPTDEWRDRFDEEPGDALAYAYDIIVNGNELGGGSFRIHEPDIQARVFDLLALTEQQQRSQFGFLLDALAMGAPPHGGIALGIDRMTMVLAGEPNLRDVIAFPKNQAGLDPMSGAPTRDHRRRSSTSSGSPSSPRRSRLSARVVQRLLSLAAVALLAGLVAIAVVERRDAKPVAAPTGAVPRAAAGTRRSPRRGRPASMRSGRAAGSC